ncbi:hypothetical protein EUX98_g5427 [Antrodiella citrinella]|uniref:F-box domain-containing protein n=1 Tax=Antrodiella citrinella TaxID=2447956 RepID=A0A4S4MRH2_9APHY|nr:hypothetical protein EUX98_g5427 [Antrodiella citrinella]
MPHRLGIIPLEVLEHIAFFVATQDELGPPSGLIPLISANRKMASLLSPSANPHLYARIFAYKFDTGAARRRLTRADVSTTGLCAELQRRCILLKRIRAKLDSTFPFSDKVGDATAHDVCKEVGDAAARGVCKLHQEDDLLSKVLWSAYLMMLENDGKNEKQLREYAGLDGWLKEFWFAPTGASRVMSALSKDSWPAKSENMSLGMWLFWLMLKPEDYMQDDAKFREATGILKLVALGAHHYPLCYPIWTDFIPTRRLHPPTAVQHYLSTLYVVAPAPSAAAILSYLTLTNKLSASPESMNYMKPLAPTVATSAKTRDSKEWDGDWARTLSIGDAQLAMGNTLTAAFKPGSLEGVWEGLFTYTEFTAYAALLSGAPPITLQHSLVAQHRQTWKLREYHLDEKSTSQEGNGTATAVPLSPGNPARGYVPNGTHVREGPTHLEIIDPGRKKPHIYHSLASLAARRENGARVKDVFITGEGHSAWGQFNLLGRVRPCDGFISLSKEYVDGDRGKWLYRGYLVGDANGNLAGRWRDTLTPPHVAGYEGCFVMSRRR